MIEKETKSKFDNDANAINHNNNMACCRSLNYFHSNLLEIVYRPTKDHPSSLHKSPSPVSPELIQVELFPVSCI